MLPSSTVWTKSIDKSEIYAVMQDKNIRKILRIFNRAMHKNLNLTEYKPDYM